MARPIKWRCGECGLFLRGDERCPTHPGELRVEWTHVYATAYDYVCRAAARGLAGRALADWCQDADPNEVAGTEFIQRVLCLTWARRWKRPEFQETGEAVKPMGGLFGPRVRRIE